MIVAGRPCDDPFAVTAKLFRVCAVIRTTPLLTVPSHDPHSGHAHSSPPCCGVSTNIEDYLLSRRQFLSRVGMGFGALGLASVLDPSHLIGAPAGKAGDLPPVGPLMPKSPHFAGKARAVIHIFAQGAPSHVDTWDPKAALTKMDGKSIGSDGGVAMASPFAFKRYGKSGIEVSDLFAKTAAHVDDMAVIRSMYTDIPAHDVATVFMNTGSVRITKPSLGSWVVYGLGTENQNLPGFIVLVSGGKTPDGGKSLWGSGFLPSVYQGVQCRAQGDPVLFLSNPADVSRPERRRVLDAIGDINREQHARHGDPETLTRIAQYELAFRMQVSASEAMDLSRETAAVHARYGTQPGAESFANNCLLARRLAERGVRFIQLYHWGWDSHGASESEALTTGFPKRCLEVDQPIGALLSDLKERGLLEETLVIWGGEFGRTPMRENRNGQEMKFVGRDHHPGAFTVWLAGGGVKPGFSYGATDEMGYNIVENPVEVRDLQATIIRLLGFDHHKLSLPFQGLDQKITGVKPTRIVREIIA